MRMIWARRVICTTVVLAAGQLAWAQAASAPAIAIPEESLKGKLEAAQVRQIDEYIQFHAKQLARASAEDGILAARDGLLKGYAQYDSPPYRSTFAQSGAKALLPLLDATGDLKALRRVNAGMVLARMPQPALRIPLEKMAVHPDPAVRYLGWSGLAQIRSALLAQNKDLVQKFFQLLGQQMAKEASPPVLGAMMDVMNLGRADLTQVSEENKKLAHEESFTVLLRNWPTCVKSVAAGSTAMACACRDGAMTLLYLDSVLGGDKARHKALLQGMVDLMWAGATAYESTLKGAEKLEGKAKADAEARMENLANMLLAAEATLNSITGKKNAYVQKAMTGGKPKERGTDLMLAVLDWAKDLKADGVVEPTLPPASKPGK